MEVVVDPEKNRWVIGGGWSVAGINFLTRSQQKR